MYANASKVFDESRKALRIYQYNLARLEVNAAKLYPKDCGDAFRGTTGLKYPAMLAKREELHADLVVPTNKSMSPNLKWITSCLPASTIIFALLTSANGVTSVHIEISNFKIFGVPQKAQLKVICKPSDIEEIEGDCMFVARLENSDENLLNKVVHNADEAYALYNDYALRMGFSIRKGKPIYYNGMKNIKQCEFLCSKEGFKLDEDFCKEKYSKRVETRTGCKAFVRFTVENVVWRVSAFNLEHNHELALQSERHLLRSGCRISKLKADVIDTMVNAGMRSSELDEDFRCKQGAPQKAVKKSGILGHAAQVYTYKIFNLFENQFLNSLAMIWDQLNCQDTIGVFEVKEENSEKVFSIKNLTRILSQYILKRLTKEVKKGMMTYEQDNHSLSNDKEAKIVYHNSMLRLANTVISKSQGEDSLKRICQKLLLELDEKIEKELSRVKFSVDANVKENEVIQCDTTDEMPYLPNKVSVLNPPCVRSKSLRNTRLKGHFEKHKANTSKDASSSRKRKQQAVEEHSNVSFSGTYHTPDVKDGAKLCCSVEFELVPKKGNTSANVIAKMHPSQ
uniref:FAR1 domain-containing protein n=1 Tax=Quercus lobata TaxID=97700 RepID=A0A7N2KUU4_QUELO